MKTTFTKNHLFTRLLLLLAICAIGINAQAANPTITIIGDNPYTHDINTPYNDLGATAVDDNGNDITSLVITDIVVNETVAGYGSVKYTVTDANGNTSSATRTVIVTDRIKPTLNIIPKIIIVALNDFSFVEPTVTATDNYFPTVNLTRTGSYNVTQEGTYPILYKAQDGMGNSDTGTRLIIVRKNGTTGINDIITENGFTIYPNPTAGRFEIEFAANPGEKAEITVVNTLGQIISTVNTADISGNKVSADISGAAPGIYFVQIKTGEKIATQKFTLSR